MSRTPDNGDQVTMCLFVCYAFECIDSLSQGCIYPGSKQCKKVLWEPTCSLQLRGFCNYAGCNYTDSVPVQNIDQTQGSQRKGCNYAVYAINRAAIMRVRLYIIGIYSQTRKIAGARKPHSDMKSRGVLQLRGSLTLYKT